MKILMTADTVGGVWTYAIELARALERYGIHVHLATQGAPLSEDQRLEVDRAANVTLHASTYELEWMNEPWDDVAAAGKWLLELERRISPDVVHLNEYAHAALPFDAPRLVVGHSCVLSWWRAVRGERAPARYDRYRAAVREGLRCADAIAAPTAAMARALLVHYAPPRTVRVMPNGRDASRFVPGTKRPIVFAAGRAWDQAKNLTLLGEAAASLPWPVYIAGDTRHPDGRIAHLGAARAIGRVVADELRAWYASASIYALPALYEPFGLSVLEAALSGCALVLGDTPSLREVWADTATFVDPGDALSLRRALRLLISDPTLRSRLAERARTRALDYDSASFGTRYQQLYAELAATRVLAKRTG